MNLKLSLLLIPALACAPLHAESQDDAMMKASAVDAGKMNNNETGLYEQSIKTTKQSIARETLEVFLRFNHRYWFHEISNQVQAADFFKRWSHQLGSDALYNEVREEARDINEYLDADRARKQTDNAMRLTVVSACGMVGTIVTGFLGMNLYSHSDQPVETKFLIFFAAFIPTVLLAIYTVMISRRLASVMEALSSEGLSWGEKLSTFRQIWGADKRALARARAQQNSAGFSSDSED